MEDWRGGPGIQKGDQIRPCQLSTTDNAQFELQDIVCDSLDCHLGTNELIHSNQWGFKKGVSTESLLLYLTETWKEAIDDGYKVGVIFLDFKRAFDTVDHAILKSELSDVGVSGVFHKWIASYLHER